MQSSNVGRWVGGYMIDPTGGRAGGGAEAKGGGGLDWRRAGTHERCAREGVRDREPRGTCRRIRHCPRRPLAP